jgi:hypothetical protein
MVRSKSDRRWNLRGQYSSSDWWDPPTSNWPPEASDAVQQLQTSLGEHPPEDLRCLYLPYPRGKLQRLFRSSVLIATERQGALHDLTERIGLSILGLDRAHGEIQFGKPGQEPTHKLTAQALGTLDEQKYFWYWAWAAEASGALDAHVLQSAAKLREYGTKRGIPELTYQEIALGIEDDRPWFNVTYLSKIACHLCDADFVVAGTSAEQPTWREFWLVTAPGILSPPDSVARRVFFVIKEALGTWGPNLGGSPARKAVEAYANQKNCTVSDWTGRAIEWSTEPKADCDCRIRIDDASGGSMYIDFDELGDIARMECLPPRQEKPARPSWLNRLLNRG